MYKSFLEVDVLNEEVPEERFENLKSGLKNKIKEKIDSLIKV